MKKLLIFIALFYFGVAFYGLVHGDKVSMGEPTIASWFDSDKIECASRDYPVGTVLRVTYDETNYLHPCILVPVTSAGPSLTEYRNGRHLDLSHAAFAELAYPSVGLIQVEVEPVK